MRTPRVALGLIVAATLAHAIGHAQAPAAGPTFEVVSIKPSAPETGPTYTANIVTPRPDGGLTAVRTPVATLIARAYPGMSRPDMIGLPDWARQFYDVHATSSLSVATAHDRVAMMRAMLADRFRLLAHTERREVPSFDLTLANTDGAVGPGLARIDVDCDAVLDPNVPRPCTFVSGPSGARGDATLATLASMLRGPAGRVVVNKTGLKGSYRLNLAFEPAIPGGPSTASPSGDSPSVFTTVREQLGLRLEPSRTERDVLVIDRLERPTEN